MTDSPGYSVREFAQFCEASEVALRFEDKLRHLIVDSRNYRHRPGSVFFALQGPRHDGHHFAPDAYRAGVRNFVLSEKDVASRLPEANIVWVDNTLEALQRVAAAHRATFRFPLIAVTGSNGKTVVKEWLYQLLQVDYRIARSPKSYNSQVGVPLSVWTLDADHDLAIFEAGISQIGEMEKLESVLKPDIGVFTNIGEAHQKNFPDLRTKVREKLALFTDASVLVYCQDHPLVRQEAERAFHGQRITWSNTGPADLQIVECTETNGRTHLQGTFHGRAVGMEIPFVDSASVENACHCWALLLHLGTAPSAIADRMATLAPVAMRLEQIEGRNGCSIINDSYNSDLNALAIALDFLRRQGKNRKNTAIVSDIGQSGVPAEELYTKVRQMISDKGVETFVGIGPELLENQGLFSGINAAFYADTEAFLIHHPIGDFHNENILVKGARSFTFERIVDALRRKSHDTILEIDLAKVTENLNYIRSLLAPDVKVMAVVKAFAYGSGSFEVARLLEFNRVEYLAVAYADEGIALREAGIAMPILVLNPEEPSYPAMIAHRLEPLIYSFRTLHLFKEALGRRGSAQDFPVHIKVDTGMHRLGFDPADMPRLGKALNADKALRVNSVFAHLSAAESSERDETSKKQIQRFRRASDTLAKLLPTPFDRHMVNSAGIARHPGAHFDMVRVGLALHGLSAVPSLRDHLVPVAKMTTSVSQIHEVAAGEGVGYSPKKTLVKNSRIATLPVGYADGLRRSLGNGNGRVYIAGSYAPFVGSICMDMCMVDVTDIACHEGAQVEVFGPHIPVYELAENMDTIPYEVLTGISPRVRRVFVGE